MSAKLSPSQRLAKERAKAEREALELAMLQQIKALRLDAGMHRQYRFDPRRYWAADFAWPDRRLMLEIDGGVFTQGGHNRGTGYTKDRERDAEATLAGWRVFRATGEQVHKGMAADWLVRAFTGVPA